LNRHNRTSFGCGEFSKKIGDNHDFSAAKAHAMPRGDLNAKGSSNAKGNHRRPAYAQTIRQNDRIRYFEWGEYIATTPRYSCGAGGFA